MNRMDRLLAILIQLQSKRVVTASEIARRFDVNVRTVYRDIRSLEAAGVPIGSEPGLGYFLAQGYRLPPVMFTAEEARALITAGKFVDKLTDRTVKGHFDTAIYKIRAVLHSRDKEDIDELQGRIGVHSPALTGMYHDTMADIQAALGAHRVIAIRYHTPQRPHPLLRQVEPLALGLFESKWHLIAYCRLRQAYRDFRVDRIETVAATPDVFDPSRHGTVEEILKGMLTGRHLNRVVLRFEKGAAYDMIKQKCRLGLVEERDLGGRVEVTLMADSLNVLGKWLIDLNEDIEIVTPPALKTILTDYAAAIARRYLS